MTSVSEIVPDLADNEGVANQPMRRVGVLVLSMHRSGSSAITRMLNLLGCDLPLTPMPVAFDNPQGHWESQRVADFNNEILALAGTQWDDWLPLNPRLSETLMWPQLVARGRQVLRDEFAESPLFVLKDPRICKLVGFWLEVLAAEAIDPAFVLALRNPIEVARSLVTRNGIEEHQGLLIWLRHVLAAEAATRGRPRVFTDFATLLDNWEALAARLSAGLGLVWPRVSALSGVEISQALDPELRHHVSDTAEIDQNPAISSWVRDAYEVLLGWARYGENSTEYLKLDTISRSFDEAGIAFARPMFNAGVARQYAAQLEVACVTLTEERDGFTAQYAALSEERDKLAWRLGEVQAEYDQVCNQHDILTSDRNGLAGEYAALGEERDKLTWRLGEVDARLEAANAQNAATAARTAELKDNLANSQADISELTHQKAFVESTLRQREEEIAQIGAELKAAKHQAVEHSTAAAAVEARNYADRLSARLTEDSAAAETTRKRVALALSVAEDRATRAEAEKNAADRRSMQRSAEVVQLKDALRSSNSVQASIKTELSETQSRLDNRFAEIGQLTRLYRDQEQKISEHRHQAEWLRQLHAVLQTVPRWWSFMPQAWSRDRQLRRLQRKGLFDGPAYLARYPDVAALGMDPLRHYILHGAGENREI